MFLLAWSLELAAAAHPFGARYAAHHTVMDLHRDQITIRYTADVPATLLDQGHTAESLQTELTSGLLLQVDRERVDLRPVAPTEVRDNEDTNLVILSLHAATPSGYHLVELSNGNLPLTPAWFASVVQVDGTLQVIDSSLLRWRDTTAYDDSGRWRLGDGYRTVEVEVEHRGHLSQAWDHFSGKSPSPRALKEAVPPAPRDVIVGRATSPALFGVGVALSTVAGLAGRTTVRAATAWLLLGSLLIAADTLWPLGAGVDLFLGLAIASIVAISIRLPGLPVGQTAAIAIAVGVHVWQLGLVVLGCSFGLMAWQSTRSGEHASSMQPAVGAIAMLLLLRGGAGLWS